MNIFQIVMLIGSGLLIASVILPPSWQTLKKIIANQDWSVDSSVDKPEVDSKPSENPTLVEIVECWECLKNKCDKANLKHASDSLDEIFPLLRKETVAYKITKEEKGHV